MFVCLRSLVTPPLHVEPTVTPRSAQRSLPFKGRSSRPHSDPVPPTSDPVALSNHSCPDVSSLSWQTPVVTAAHSMLHTPPCLAPDTDQLHHTLTEADCQREEPAIMDESHARPLYLPHTNRRVDRTPVTTHADECLPSPSYVPRTDQLEHTLPAHDDQQCADPAIMDESGSPSRWSASDYFRRYPAARLDSVNTSLTCCDQQQRSTDAGYSGSSLLLLQYYSCAQ